MKQTSRCRSSYKHQASLGTAAQPDREEIPNSEFRIPNSSEARKFRIPNLSEAREFRILVIGATSGIGRALVIELRARGFTVIAAGRRADLLDSLGGETLQLDATAEDALEKIAQVNASAIFFNAGFGERSRLPDWERTQKALALNVVAFERVAQWALTHCQYFIATASIAGIRGLEDTNGYSASKAYMLNAMEGYRRKARHGKYPCRYVTLVPGFVDTAMGGASNFWKCSPERAVFCILKGIERGRQVIYVTARWRFIAWILRWLPRGLFERIPIKGVNE